MADQPTRLPADDLTTGQSITVLKHNPPQEAEAPNPFDMAFTGGRSTARREDRSLYGAVLEVQAVNLPFLLCEYVGPNPAVARGTRLVLDTREYEVMRLREEYVAAMREAVEANRKDQPAPFLLHRHVAAGVFTEE